MAVRASLRRVLETVSLADVAAGRLPDHVLELADEYETAMVERPPGGDGPRATRRAPTAR
jgi:hypothetical protein